ncbi:hypothetical protein VTN00DRAFT_8544 [Thermoascus crustaceus]|uniref:uncharacterized protein n=1 Tax=Thermoascus crustaceus TaxID=5088 RepID=UPI0037440F8A
MSADSTPASSEARELSLISKVELRIALADTDTKLQSLLQTYLAPLLLKLASESLAVRNKVIAVCQHINTRIKPQSIQLPVATLLKQFKEQKSQLIRHFDLLYIQQGIDRIDSAARVDLLPPLLQGISEIGTVSTQGANIFNLVLRLLPLLKLPQKGSPEDAELRTKLGLSAQDVGFLSSWFGKLLLLSPGDKDAKTCPGLTPQEYTFLNKGASPSETWNPSATGGLNLTETKVAVTKFLASGAFTDSERFLPAVIASADTNSRLSDIGEDILKRFSPDLENPDVVQQLYKLYFGTEGIDGAPPARPPLQVKILAFLGKSVIATMDTARIIQLLEKGLFSDAAKSAQGLQASKLRTQIFTFTTWVARMGSPSDLKVIAPKAILGLKEFVQSQGWPNPAVSGQKLSPADLGLRSLAYESIGILAPKVDSKVRADTENRFEIDLVKWLFTSLSSDASSSEIFVSIEQALGSILNSFANYPDEEFQKELRPFLVHHMGNRPGEDDSFTGYKAVRSTRFVALRFANRCLPYRDVVARWIDLMAIGGGQDREREIVEEGKRGLHPYWYRMLNPRSHGTWTASSTMELDDPRYTFPRFQDLTYFLFGPSDEAEDPGVGQLTGSKRFSAPFIGAFAPSIAFLRNILLWEAVSKSGIPLGIEQDWEYQLDALLSSNETARFALKQHIQNSDHRAILAFLGSSLDGLLWKNGEGLDQCGVHFVEVCSLTSNNLLNALAVRAPSLKDSVFSNNRTTQRMAARAFGILASHISLPEGNLRDAMADLTQRIMAWKDAIGQVANQVRGALLAMAYLLSRLAFRRRLQTIPETQIKEFTEIVFDILENARDSELREAAQVAVGQFSLSGILSLETLPGVGSWKIVRGKLLQDAKKENETSISTLGRFSLIFPKGNDDAAAFTELLDSIYDLHEIRSPEVQFAVGASLSVAAAGWESKSLVGEFDVDEEPPKSDISTVILATMADKIIAGCGASKPSLRKASAIWLLCLVKDCGHMREIQDRLRKCQAAFTRLLADRDEVVQESGSRGLSLVYEIGDQDLKDDLVRDLVRSFTGNGSNLGGGRVSADTELFEPGALPTGEGSSVTTYKDIMNLASEVGDPSLVYRFMTLASNNAIWSSRAAFGRFGLSNVLSDSSVNGYLARNPKLYQKLYRYRFDPNPNVQRSMNDIWQALVKDSNAVIDVHFDEIMEDLLKSIMAGREWRVRQASCAAIADLIQGRPLEKYDKYMNEILTKAFKVMDDIKETVRAAALRLCQTIINMVIRHLETGEAGSKRAKAMLGHVVPFLLGHEGMESSAQEVQAYAVATLIQISKKSPAVVLRPFVPQILEKFLGSLSSLEPQAVNYIHLNADKYGLTGQDIDKMRLSSIRMSPMTEVIERYLLDSLDEASMKEVAVRLEEVLRSAVGLPSKVGCSRVLVILSMKTILFQPYADRFIQLLKKYVLDRNDTVSASYSTSIGYLIRLATDDRVLDTIEFSKSLYFQAEEVSHRAISAEILYSTSKLSNDRFSAFAAASLPFVFVAKHDTDDQVKEVFEKTWQDNVGGSRAISLYLKEILGLITEHLDSPRWAIKHTAALAIADTITSLDKDINLATGGLIWPVLEKALAGKTWNGKEIVVKAFVRFTRHAKIVWQERKPIGEQMRTIALREAKRNNPAYRPNALNALGEFAEIREDLDLMPDALNIVLPVVRDVTEDQGDKMDIDSSNVKKASVDDTLAACVNCLLRCFNAAVLVPTRALKDYLSEMTPIIEDALRHGGKTVQATLYEGLKALFDKLDERLSRIDDRDMDPSQLEASLVALADRLLFREVDLPLETIRTKRAQATAGYITVCQRVKFRVPETPRQRIVAWLGQERSGPVQRILSQALGKLDG